MLTLLYVHSYSTFIQGIFRLQNCKERTFFLFQGIFSCRMIMMISTICKLSKTFPSTQPKLKKKHCVHFQEIFLMCKELAWKKCPTNITIALASSVNLQGFYLLQQCIFWLKNCRLLAHNRGYKHSRCPVVHWLKRTST